MPVAARRPVLLVAAMLLLAASLAACTSGQRPPTPRQPRPSGKPNIVFVLTDDLSSNLVPFMPHVLALERAGTSFTNYTVTDSECCPSRASIFTGMYPHDTHVLTNNLPDGGFDVFYRRGEQRQTFATALSAAGYRTAMLGKFLNNYNPAASMGRSSPYVPPGWSTWDVAGRRGYDEFGYALNQDHSVVRYGRGRANYLTTVLDREANGFVRRSAAARTPFLLEVATFAPHRPYVPAPTDRNTFPGVGAPRTPAFDRLPSNPPAWLAHQAPLTDKAKRRINDDFRRRVEDVQSVDRMIGDLERTLQRTGQADNTYIVFSSDNGYHMGEYRLTPGKLTAFDTDVHVPLVVSGPGVPAGAQNPAIVQNVDLAPTFDAIGGAQVPRETDGRSMLPLWHGTTPSDWPTLALVEHHGPDYNKADPDYPPHGSGNPPSYEAIRSAEFTSVRYVDGEREYYDRSRDPYELHNLAPELPASRQRALDADLRAMVTCHGQAACQRAADVPQAALTASGLPRRASTRARRGSAAHAAAPRCTSGRAPTAGRHGRSRTGCTPNRRAVPHPTRPHRRASAGPATFRASPRR
jgi:N-acetylglucosamine-6-sulfatase